MKHQRRTASVAVLLSVLTATPGLANAQTADAWEFGGAVYGWFPTISGNTAFPAGSTGSDISISTRQILDSLEFVFMGALEARKGRWGAFTDVVYMSAGASAANTRELTVGGRPLPADATADLRLDVRSVIWTLGGTWRLDTAPGKVVDLLAGARLLDMRQTLAWQLTGNLGNLPLAGPGGRAEVDINHWDAIVGAKGRFDISGPWFVPFHADIGAGDSDLTWQLMAGVGYRLQAGHLIAAWRHLDYRMKADRPIESASFGGPTLGFVMRW